MDDRRSTVGAQTSSGLGHAVDTVHGPGTWSGIVRRYEAHDDCL